MTTDEREIQALREFRAGMGEPSAERLARVRARGAYRADERPVRRRWPAPGLAIPAIAAAAVLVVATGAAVIGFFGTGSTISGSGTPGGSVPTSQVVGPPDTGTEKTQSVPDPTDRATHQAAVAKLEQFAATAATGPAALAVPAGKLLYVRGEGSSTNGTAGAGGLTSKKQTYLHELWLEPEGDIVRMVRRTDDGKVTVLTPDTNNPKDNLEAEAARQRADLSRLGAGLHRPTPAYLAGLPTDPQRMLDALRGLVPDKGAWSADHAIFDGLRQLLYDNEPLLTPAVRAALCGALAKLDSVTLIGQVAGPGGRQLTAIGQTERGQRQEFLFDAQSGRIVGSRSGQVDQAEPGFADLWSYAVVAKPGDTA
ncbi:MAG: CU044_5270 family protein [Labedaea sp.]